MQWKDGHKVPAQLTSLPLDTITSSMPHPRRGDLNQPLPLSVGNNDGLPLPPWIHYPQSPDEHIQFRGDMLNLPYKDVLDGTRLPLSGVDSNNGFNETEKGISSNSSLMETDFKLGGFYHDMDAHKGYFLKPHNEGEHIDNTSSTEYCLSDQTSNSLLAKRIKDNSGDSHPYSRANVPKSRCVSKTNISQRHRAAENDRLRKLRIDERISALHKLIPHSKENDKASQVDDIIDHIKFLQLRMKELSRTRLGGKSNAGKFVFLEGYGHFLLHEHMMHEPLEEMMGKLIEVDPPAAGALLQSKGLSMVPMALAKGFRAQV